MLVRPAGCLCAELGVCEREIRMYVTHQLFKCPLFPDIWSVCVCVCAGNGERRHGSLSETETNRTFGNTWLWGHHLTSPRLREVRLLFWRPPLPWHRSHKPNGSQSAPQRMKPSDGHTSPSTCRFNDSKTSVVWIWICHFTKWALCTKRTSRRLKLSLKLWDVDH